MYFTVHLQNVEKAYKLLSELFK